MPLLKLVPDNTNIDFLRWRWFAIIVSTLLVAASVLFIATRGLNLGVDFVGGQMVRVTLTKPVPVEDLRARIGQLDLGDASIQQFGSPNEVAIRMPLPPAANQGSIYENQTALQRRYFEPASVALPRQST